MSDSTKTNKAAKLSDTMTSDSTTKVRLKVVHDYVRF